MSEFFEIVENNKDKIIDAMDEAVERALEAIGLQAVNYAVAKCPVDTGLLRNSITHAIGGKGVAVATYQSDDGSSTGAYSGTAPFEKDTVYVGTNVGYAPYVELGHMTPSGKQVPGAHFIEKAATGHTAHYKQLAETALKGF